MPGIKSLTTLMRQLENQLAICVRCGMCQAVCPLFAETGREGDVARGKLALLDGILQQMFKNPQGVYERLSKCLLCGSCAANCPSSVNALEIFIKARAIITGYMGLSPAKKLVLRGLLSRPQIFDRIMEWGTIFQKIIARPASDVIGTSCARVVSPLLKGRHFVPLAPVPFHRMTPALDSNPGRSGIKAAFYVGCLADKMFPAVARSVVDVLDRCGVGLYLPAGQGCCGIPALSSGDTLTFRRLVLHNLELFDPEKFDYLVTPCATCTATIREIWPMMIQTESDTVRANVTKIADKTLDISRFIASKIGLEAGDAESRADGLVVTYHDPCHLKKTLGVYEEPRRLIEASPGYRLREMPESDWCCGLGGSFSLKYYELSSNIGQRKAENIMATGCSVVATGCPACMLQISDMLSKTGRRIKVKHPVEIYASSFRQKHARAGRGLT